MQIIIDIESKKRKSTIDNQISIILNAVIVSQLRIKDLAFDKLSNFIVIEFLLDNSDS